MMDPGSPLRCVRDDPRLDEKQEATSAFLRLASACPSDDNLLIQAHGH